MQELTFFRMCLQILPLQNTIQLQILAAFGKMPLRVPLSIKIAASYIPSAPSWRPFPVPFGYSWKVPRTSGAVSARHMCRGRQPASPRSYLGWAPTPHGSLQGAPGKEPLQSAGAGGSPKSTKATHRSACHLRQCAGDSA